jgi:hypothetical protein
LVSQAYAYGVGRAPVPAERKVLEYLEAQFVDSGYRITDLMRQIVMSKAFVAVSPLPTERAASDNQTGDRS